MLGASSGFVDLQHSTAAHSTACNISSQNVYEILTRSALQHVSLAVPQQPERSLASVVDHLNR